MAKHSIEIPRLVEKARSNLAERDQNKPAKIADEIIGPAEQFRIDAGTAAPEAPFRATLVLTDHLGATHSTQVILH